MRLLACGGCGHGGGRGSGRTSEPGEPPSPLMKGEQAGVGESERGGSRLVWARAKGVQVASRLEPIDTG